MIQSQSNSLIESLINTAVGFGISILLNVLLLPHYGAHITLSANLQLTLIFTIASISRGYLVRRFFTKRTEAAQ